MWSALLCRLAFVIVAVVVVCVQGSRIDMLVYKHHESEALTAAVIMLFLAHILLNYMTNLFVAININVASHVKIISESMKNIDSMLGGHSSTQYTAKSLRQHIYTYTQLYWCVKRIVYQS